MDGSTGLEALNHHLGRLERSTVVVARVAPFMEGNTMGMHKLDLGEVGECRAWWEVPLPPCPGCGGNLVWYEAGYVPGTRRCEGCGQFYRVEARGGRAELRWTEEDR